MSGIKEVPITIHDHTGKVLGVVMSKPKSALLRATWKPPWVNVCRTAMKAYIVGSGRGAELHLRLPEGEPPPKRMVPSK